MAESNRKKLRAMIDSAFGLKGKDNSPEARTIRTKDLKGFEGLTCVVRVGVEKGAPKRDSNGNLTGGNYDDKNIVAAVITPDNQRDWHPVEQAPPFNNVGGAAAIGTASASAPTSAAPASTPALPVTRPNWAE